MDFELSMYAAMAADAKKGTTAFLAWCLVCHPEAEHADVKGVDSLPTGSHVSFSEAERSRWTAEHARETGHGRFWTPVRVRVKPPGDTGHRIAGIPVATDPCVPLGEIHLRDGEPDAAPAAVTWPPPAKRRPFQAMCPECNRGADERVWWFCETDEQRQEWMTRHQRETGHQTFICRTEPETPGID